MKLEIKKMLFGSDEKYKLKRNTDDLNECIDGNIILERVSLETTRRCNSKCSHCMRGPSQNVDLTPEMVDIFLDTNGIARIKKLLFTGGEPTLNSDIIIYTINKIISENLDVFELIMVTNGQVFDSKLVEAFKRFNEYRNKRLGADSSDSHVRITFSTDPYHKEISPDIREKYFYAGRGISFTDFCVDPEQIYKTGFSTFGNPFEYKLAQFRYYGSKEAYVVFDNLHITATGYATSEGDGQYTDMDNINMGHISNTSIMEMLAKYGTVQFGSKKVELEQVVYKKIDGK